MWEQKNVVLEAENLDEMDKNSSKNIENRSLEGCESNRKRLEEKIVCNMTAIEWKEQINPESESTL